MTAETSGSMSFDHRWRLGLVLSVDQRPVGEGVVGPLIAKIRDAYFGRAQRLGASPGVAHAGLSLVAHGYRDRSDQRT